MKTLAYHAILHGGFMLLFWRILLEVTLVGIATVGHVGFDLWRYPKYVGDPKIFWKYRLLQQVPFQYGLYILVYLLVGIWPTIIAWLWWWFGICDILYYLIGGYDIWNEKSWYWLDWTPFGLVLTAILYLQGSVPKREERNLMTSVTVLIQGIVGLIVSLFIWARL